MQSGSKLDFAKKACKKLVKHLESFDTLHFVAYDDKVKTIFQNGDLSEGGKDALRTSIDAIRTGGTTNLCGGLERAVELLRETSNNSTDTVQRIFLFSDGCVNAGVIDHGEICQRVAAWASEGITTTAFGIGSDFDEPLMRQIAESGKGRYTFLATAQDIPRLVSKSIHDLLKLYGSEASIDIRGSSHTTVARVYGADDGEEDVQAATGLLELGDLHSANERMVLLELDCSPPGDADGLTFESAAWSLSFQRNASTVQFSGALSLTAVRDRAALGKEDAAVQAMFSIRHAGDLESEVADHLARRNLTLARQTKSKQMALLAEAVHAAREDPSVDPTVVATLERVQQRAQRVADQLANGEDMELTRRQCVQESDLNRAFSVAGFSDGRDSSDGSEPGAENLRRRLRDFDDDIDDNMSSISGGSIESLDDEDMSAAVNTNTEPTEAAATDTTAPASSKDNSCVVT